jgi:putative serine protease PepD
MTDGSGPVRPNPYTPGGDPFEPPKPSFPAIYEQATDDRRQPTPNPPEPQPSDPAPSDPVPSDPEPRDPAPSDPAPSDPAPSDPVPSDPVPGDTGPTAAAPSDTESSQPGEPAVPEPVGPAPAPTWATAPTDTPAADTPAGDTGPRPGSARRMPVRWLVATAVIAALIGGGVGAATVAVLDRHDDTVHSGLKVTDETGAPSAQLNGTIGAAAAKIRPSVVTLQVSGSQESGTGSGVVIRSDGYVLTNDHVVSIAGTSGTITVILSDGASATARIVGTDPSDDLAVVQVSTLGTLTAATFGRSDSLSVGQSVVAVGAPLGLSDTVTSGIISNLARPVRSGDNSQAVFDAVQTDAAINPGNSGGPLVDLNGSVVGINAAIATENSGGLQAPGDVQQSGSIGIGFAIGADEARRIAGELIATGKATHAVLGVTVNGSTSAANSAVTLQTVAADGPAATAGLKVGDAITTLDGQRVGSADGLIGAVRSRAPGQRISLSYVRGGKSTTVTITLGSSPS